KGMRKDHLGTPAYSTKLALENQRLPNCPSPAPHPKPLHLPDLQVLLPMPN
ncbi:hypothetical protein BOTBODRAFT_31068, partial [Botryobasidium botryosum FD-172 SS1]